MWQWGAFSKLYAASHSSAAYWKVAINESLREFLSFSIVLHYAKSQAYHYRIFSISQGSFVDWEFGCLIFSLGLTFFLFFFFFSDGREQKVLFSSLCHCSLGTGCSPASLPFLIFISLHFILFIALWICNKLYPSHIQQNIQHTYNFLDL